MERLTGKDLRRISEFLRELYQLRTHEEFTNHLIVALPTIMEGEFTSYNEINHRQGTGSFKTDHPGFLENPAHYGQALARQAHSHPILQYFETTHDRSATTISDCVSQREFRDTGLYKEFFEPLRIPYTIGFALEIDSHHSITLAQHKGGREFSERTRAALNAIRPHVLQGFQNALAVTQMQEQLTALDQVMEAGHQAVLSVTTEGRIRFSTPHAQQLFTQYGLRIKRGSEWLPSSLRAWLRGQIAHLQSPDDVAPTIAPLTIAGTTGTLHIHIVPKAPYVLLMLQENRPTSTTNLAHLGLSARETEILTWVIQGKTNPEIGMILSISSRTVQKHLERVYSRLGVENRHAAISHVLNVNQSGQ
ncbi:MAG: helix-turn-helix transcriptional regulator [Nitrospira sp.]|nr:helix-turn-helix transcriptional regulator [Nitrospira sp.]